MIQTSMGVVEADGMERSRADLEAATTNHQEEKSMKMYLSGALITVIGLFVLAAGVHAEAGHSVVHIQRDFVAGGKVLPAGTYRIYEGSPGTGQVLILRGEEPGASALLIPITRDASFPQRLHATLTQVGDLYYLSEVATELGVYTLAPPQIVPPTARDIDRMDFSGSH